MKESVLDAPPLPLRGVKAVFVSRAVQTDPVCSEILLLSPSASLIQRGTERLFRARAQVIFVFF